MFHNCLRHVFGLFSIYVSDHIIRKLKIELANRLVLNVNGIKDQITVNLIFKTSE
jgi:hypothetical protein